MIKIEAGIRLTSGKDEDDYHGIANAIEWSDNYTADSKGLVLKDAGDAKNLLAIFRKAFGKVKDAPCPIGFGIDHAYAFAIGRSMYYLYIMHNGTAMVKAK